MKITSFLLLFLIVIGCNSSSEKTVPDEMTPDVPDLTYLALGDSYTIGESVEEMGRWPVQLVDSLRKQGFEMEDAKIIARTGWTTGNLLQAMDDQLSGNEQYDLVSVLIGVNNQYQGRSIDDFEEDLNTIFTRAIALSKEGSEDVFVVSIPDYGVTPFGASNSEEISRQIVEFNDVLKRVAAAYDLDFYNITPISKRAKDEPDLIADDGLHPSEEMYRLWVQEFFEEIAQKLEE